MNVKQIWFIGFEWIFEFFWRYWSD